MNQQIKSHWRLAWRSFKLAIKVTLNTIAEDRRARRHQLKIAPDLRSQKDFFAQIDVSDEQS